MHIPKLRHTLTAASSLDGADFVIGMFQIGGYDPCTITDFDIPNRFGLRQTIADTLGIGGIMRGLRTIPVYLDMCRDMQELCPDAWLLNYVNPMAINTWAINRATPIKTVGLCHSVQGTAEHLAELIGVAHDEINFICAGINHLAFYLRFEHQGEDLYPKIWQVIKDGRVPDTDRVRFDVGKRLGYFMTESSEHFAEYSPWFIKQNRQDLIDKFNIPLDEYIRRCKVQIAGWEMGKEFLINPETPIDMQALASHLVAAGANLVDLEQIQKIFMTIDQVSPSKEYGARIIHAMETNQPTVIYGNVMNHGLISNLSSESCVEVPCLVDRNGIQPTTIGNLPTQLAALIQTNINVQALTVEAALTGKREHIYHAAMLDPHTAAELDPDQIYALVDALIEAHGEWLPEYRV